MENETWCIWPSTFDTYPHTLMCWYLHTVTSTGTELSTLQRARLFQGVRQVPDIGADRLAIMDPKTCLSVTIALFSLSLPVNILAPL